MSMSVFLGCMSMHASCALKGQKRMSNPLELKLWVIEKCVLETEPMFSARTTIEPFLQPLLFIF